MMFSVRSACRIALGGVGVLCLLGLGALQSRAVTAIGVLPSESGRVHYRFTKPGLTGTSQLSWIDRGSTYRVDLEHRSRAETVLGRGKRLFMLRPANRFRPAVVQRAEVKPSDVWLNADEMPYPLPASGAGEVVGSGTVLGKPCQIRKLHHMRIWYWQGLPLRMERAATANMRPLRLEAVRLDTDVIVPEGRFEIPRGYRVTDFPGRDRAFPWAATATASLIGLLLLAAISLGVVEWAFAQRSGVDPAGREA